MREAWQGMVDYYYYYYKHTSHNATYCNSTIVCATLILTLKLFVANIYICILYMCAFMEQKSEIVNKKTKTSTFAQNWLIAKNAHT